MTARALMIQGVASSVGKTVLAAALCRIFTRRGYRVAPFKAQNMSTNAFVTADGGEISRAQALQARACGVEPRVEMNPILLKPEAGNRSQVVVLGRVQSSESARDYLANRGRLWPQVRGALRTLQSEHDLIVIEGAGSPAEVNLRRWDIANMRIARAASAPVLLVADIDRGGALAALVGTLELLTPADRARVQGLLINKFRGDASLLEPGTRFLERRTRLPVIGVVPYVTDLRLPAEDSAAMPTQVRTGTAFDVAAIRYPHLANFDDLDPLADAGASVRWVRHPQELRGACLIVLPGSKSTCADLEFLYRSGLAEAIRSASRSGAAVLGICGGYQMLGEELSDPDGLEGAEPDMRGLGLLPIRTRFQRPKITRQVSGTVVAAAGPMALAIGERVAGYEIHDGVCQVNGAGPLLLLDDDSGGRPDGALSPDGRVMGCYLHGLLHNPPLVRAIFDGLGEPIRPDWDDQSDLYDRELNRLADTVEGSVDILAIERTIGLPR